MIWRIAVTMALAASAALSPVVASAQARDRGPSSTRQELVERIRERFENRIARELRLDEQQREVLGEVFSVFARSRAELLPQRREIERRISNHLAGPDGAEEDALGLLEEMRALREREAELLREEEDRLLEVLTPSQVLRLQALRDQFGNQIRRLRGDSSPGIPGDRPFRGPRPGAGTRR
ncbi:MAG: Spy/CpxP family protein refolding chaperone [Gammaproteobacteria bacterium]|nr:Spy/CpxP family protein refolding chaperone [Gammaproteobacteria bacterium]MDE0246771.1 Spy/CpxP family protein refolding chaperone [Gammaproteobacteria bacterium]